MTSVSFEQAPLLEIGHQRGTGLIGVEGVLLDARRQVAVLIPGFVEQLHEADAAFDEPPGQQAVAGEAGVLGRFDAVAVERLLRFLAEVHQLRGARLQAIRHFVALDAGGDLRIGIRLQRLLVQPIQGIERGALRFQVDAGGVRQIQHRIAGAAKRRAAVHRRQEAAAVVAGAAAGSLGAGQHDEARQVGRFAPQPVQRPRAEAGPAELLRAGIHHDLRGGVIDGLRLHRADQAQVVGDLRGVRQDFAQFHAALPVLART